MPASLRPPALALFLASILSCRAATHPAPAPASPAPGAAPGAAPSPAPTTTSPSAAARPTLPAPEPSRFQQDVLLEGVFDEPTEISVARDGRVFIAERPGTVSVYDPRTHQQRLIARLAVDHSDENGLIGLALDPDFDRNHWLYLNYSRPTGEHHRLARFTLDGDSLKDERMLLEVKYDTGCCHTGGSIAFDGAGHLFVSYGDNTNPFIAGNFAPIDPTPAKFRADALRSAGNTKDLRGKILRITPTPDGRYTIPAGNLFPDSSVGRPEIYVMGDRNPYRISVDKHTGYLYWGEVGPDAQNDSTLGPRGYDEVNQARHAGNFGWPMFIADNQPYRNYNFTTGELHELFNSAHPLNSSPNNTGAKELPPAQPAMIYYPYVKSEKFPLVGEGGRTAMAGPVYHFGDYAASDVRLPEYYDGKFIHYDWMRGWMMAATLSPAGDYVRMEPFLSQLAFDHPVDVELGADGSLYVLEYGTYWGAKNPNARLSRITYHPNNRPPVARITASRTVGAAPLIVALSSSGSVDLDPNDAIQATWIIPGASDAVNQSSVSHTFTKPGTYKVRLRVRDRAGAETESTVDIVVGNEPPKVAIDVAGSRSFYWDTTAVRYDVRVTDREDGQLGRGIDPRRVAVTLAYTNGAASSGTVVAGHQQPAPTDGLARIRKSDCLACHGVEQASVGPAYVRVAQRYAGQPDARTRLMAKIVSGGTGVWGDRMMPPHASLTTEDTRAMVDYILSLNVAAAKLPSRGLAPLGQHASAPGGTYHLKATYADQPRNGIRSLADSAEVVLHPPRMLTSGATSLKNVGLQSGAGPDSAVHMQTTVYGGAASFTLGALDLAGIASATVDLRSRESKHPFTIELRADSASGPLLGSADVRPTVGDRWYTQSIPLSASGERPLYVVFRSSAPELGQFNPLVTIDALRFERAPGSPAATKPKR